MVFDDSIQKMKKILSKKSQRYHHAMTIPATCDPPRTVDGSNVILWSPCVLHCPPYLVEPEVVHSYSTAA